MSNLLTKTKIPRIYAYSDEHFEGCLKVGYTTRTAEERVSEQYPIKTPRQTWKIELDEMAIRGDGTFFTDHEIHNRLRKMGFSNESGEWFRCSLEAVRSAIISERQNKDFEVNRQFDFKMRPEQAEAVQKTANYFRSFEQEDEDRIPHFLWNAKMRFGKTFASYQLAKEMGWKKILVLTFKPAVLSAWREDLQSHIDFEGWQFASKKEEDLSEKDIDTSKPFVYFGSFQDMLGKDKKTGGVKIDNEWIHYTHWDCVIFDEYHFGAWRDKSKELTTEDKEEEKRILEERKELAKENGEIDIDYFDEKLLPITTNHFLYLSGTPFRAIQTGEFIEEQIFNWTYSDEQQEKLKLNDSQGKNPYLALPRMVMLTYQLPEDMRKVALNGEFNEFDLNLFFKAEGSGKNAEFEHKDEVQKWLKFVCGDYFSIEQDLKMKRGNSSKAPMPFSDAHLIHSLQHTFWFLPNVASCYAMGNLLAQNTFFNDYKIIVSAGTKAGIGIDALRPVEEAMGNPLKTKTITLSCGKLTTGVSVKPWTGIFMLRNTKSPETYFQTMFRVQTPWTVKNSDSTNPNQEEIIKEQCYVFDFAPDRALSQIATYTNQLDNNPQENKSPEQKVADFIKFLPILAYDGSAMEEIDAGKLLDIAMSGTTATLLARRWESALLVNVDNVTLQRLMKNEEAMKALMSIEGFRSLNSDIIEAIVSKSEAVKKAKKEATENEKELSKKEKKELTEEEKKTKSMRKQIQDKLIKFATRIPVFMYLSEYREQTLQDVITKLEPDLFKKVTGLSVSDFELLEKIGVFNGALMNDAVFKFKRYEDASLSYTGIETYKGLARVGGFNTTLEEQEYEKI